MSHQSTKVYCLKCKQHTIPHNTKVITMKNGRKRLAGICSKCGTKVSGIFS